MEIKGKLSHLWTSWFNFIWLVAQGKANFKPRFSHVFPLRDWKKGFDLPAMSADAVRMALAPEYLNFFIE
jgi:threonine dehydrogenase-like Zn-dependent dehydrogenase